MNSTIIVVHADALQLLREYSTLGIPSLAYHECKLWYSTTRNFLLFSEHRLGVHVRSVVLCEAVDRCELRVDESSSAGSPWHVRLASRPRCQRAVRDASSGRKLERQFQAIGPTAKPLHAAFHLLTCLRHKYRRFLDSSAPASCKGTPPLPGHSQLLDQLKPVRAAARWRDERTGFGR